MSVANLDRFVEFDEYLRPIKGTNAVRARINFRLTVFKYQIPYYNIGVDESWLFRLGFLPISEIRKLFQDIDPDIQVDMAQGRVTSPSIGFTVDTSAKALQSLQTGAQL